MVWKARGHIQGVVLFDTASLMQHCVVGVFPSLPSPAGLLLNFPLNGDLLFMVVGRTQQWLNVVGFLSAGIVILCVPPYHIKDLWGSGELPWRHVVTLSELSWISKLVQF